MIATNEEPREKGRGEGGAVPALPLRLSHKQKNRKKFYLSKKKKYI